VSRPGEKLERTATSSGGVDISHRLNVRIAIMPQRDVIVIGASAGGLQALTTIVSRLPESLPACVLVVVHAPAQSDGALPQILERAGPLPVAFARDGDRLTPRQIYVAPNDFHLIVGRDGLRVVHGPRENSFRPAVDPLFRTAARCLGPRVIGVVLSGALSDGTYGLSVIKQHGGIAIVQDPADAAVRTMPENALRYVAVDYVLPASEIAQAIGRLAGRSVGLKGVPVMSHSGLEPQQPVEETQVRDMTQLFGAPSGLTCPDCGGALWQVREGGVQRYQCHVGHQYAPENLEAGQREVVDSALWSAVRVLEEHAELKKRMAQRAAEHGMQVVSREFASGARDAHEHAERIRAVLFGLDMRGGKEQKEVVQDRARRPPPRARASRRATRRQGSAGRRQKR
jgi:two-component system, chemotaxis family, protein-glutamate methylesterase/glutaminase